MGKGVVTYGGSYETALLCGRVEIALKAGEGVEDCSRAAEMIDGIVNVPVFQIQERGSFSGSSSLTPRTTYCASTKSRKACSFSL